MQIRYISTVFIPLATLFSFDAVAADLPLRSSPSPLFNSAPRAYSWTGLYTGLNAGYGKTNNPDHVVETTGLTFKQDHSSGFVGGAQIGYNYQIGGFVAGLETDLQYAAIGNKDAYFNTVYFPDNSDGYFGTIRARAGFAIDRTLIYATGGFAYGSVGGEKLTTYLPGTAQNTETNWGWALGGGIEYSITNNISARLSGLYVNLDTGSNYLVGTIPVSRSDTEFSVISTGLNYKFGN
jgi:outer membrane immunogenic protein